jgi:hypothetical protein
VLINLVQDDRSLCFLSNEKLTLWYLVKHVVILVHSLDVLVEESATDASLQNQHGLRMLFSHFSMQNEPSQNCKNSLHLGVEALLGYAHPLKPRSYLFDHLSNLLKDVEI